MGLGYDKFVKAYHPDGKSKICIANSYSTHPYGHVDTPHVEPRCQDAMLSSLPTFGKRFGKFFAQRVTLIRLITMSCRKPHIHHHHVPGPLFTTT